MNRSVECPVCGCPFDPHATRWLCPSCKFKDTCCEGEACAPRSEPTPANATG